MVTINLTWLDKNYLEKVLRNAERDESIEVSDSTLKSATNEGDNYTSEIYRIAVEFSRVHSGDEIREKRSYIMKVAPYNDSREELFVDKGIFLNELLILSETLPKLNKILAKLSFTSLGARCLHVHKEKPLHIIVDDLASRGFRMAERQSGLDLDHCLLAIQNLGRFHAASIALKEEKPTALTNYTRGKFHKDYASLLAELWRKNVAGLASEIVNWPELNPRIADKLFKLSEGVYEKAYKVLLCREDDFNVLNHGDFWANNLMFRYDEQEKLFENIFVDFQVCHWGSPAEDILYFLGSSPADDVRIHHRELLLRKYHSSLTNTMAKLQCATEAPSFNNFKDLLQKRAFHEVLASIEIIPFMTLETGKHINLAENLSSNKEYRNPGLSGKGFRKVMTRLLPFYDSVGLLDT